VTLRTALLVAVIASVAVSGGLTALTPSTASTASADTGAHAVADASLQTIQSHQSTPIGSTAPPPLIILMDISGSMSDSVPQTNGSGSVVKLAAAKSALQQPIDNQPPGASVGIWTFPGATSSGGCDAGSWLVDVGSATQPRDILTKIAGLQAGGDTPTGPALTSVINALRARGIQSANVLVVSDGLYTCGPDPCDVAKGLAGTGFTLSIQAVGFDIAPEGRDSLKCMAEATGGSYFDASNSADLNQVITRLTTPQFDLTLSAPTHPIAGNLMTITATVKNTSLYAAEDMHLRLGFSNTPATLLTPTVIPSDIPLGTLPAGQIASRSWSFVAGEKGHSKQAVYSVSASSVETVPRPVVAGGTFTTTAPGSTARDTGDILKKLISAKQSLVILGDSYSSGEGTFSYLPGTSTVDAKCHRSPNTYLAPAFTAAKVRVEILACSGAVTANLLGPQIDGSTGLTEATSQLAQLNALGSTPGAVVMTIGGNDIGFSAIVGKCVTPGSSCTSSSTYDADVLSRPAQIASTLVASYESVWKVLNQPKFVAARHGQYAPVIVLAYPQVVHDYSQGACALNVALGTGGFDVSEVKFANYLETNLDGAIASAAKQAASDGFGVYYVNDTKSAFLPNNTVCEDATKRWVNSVVNLGKSESLHPTDDGYLAESDRIISWSKDVTTIAPSTEAKRGGTSLGVIGLLDSSAAQSAAVKLQINDLFPQVVRPSQAVFVDMPRLGQSPVTVTLHSQPRLLGTITPDAQGRVRGYVSIPADTTSGIHEIVVKGWDADGAPLVTTVVVRVTPPTPQWLYMIGIASLILVVAAIVLIVVRRRRRVRA